MAKSVRRYRRFASCPRLVKLEDRLTPVNIQNILVNNPSTDTIGSQDTQSETSTIVFGNNVLASFNDSGAYLGSSGQHFTGWSRSTDGGATFTDLGSLPGNDDAGDPSLARDSVTGRIYLATLSFAGTAINVFRSDDNGATFQTAVNGIPGLSGPSFDKEWIAVDNAPGAGQGNVYLVARNFGTGGGIVISRSTNGGTTWGTVQTLVTGTVQGADVTIGPDHSVYFFWLDGTSGNKINMRRSTNLGASFGSTVTVATLAGTATNGDLGFGTFRTNAFPQSAVNPVSGEVYVVYNDNPAGADRGDVYLSTSITNGSTWSKVKVNDDTGTNDQFFPSVSVTPDGTKVSVSYYDRRLDAANSLIDYFANIGTVNLGTGAVTLGPGFRVSNTSFPAVFGKDAAINSIYMGDYDVNAADANYFYYVWGDNRDPSTLHSGNQQNVRFAKASTQLTGPSVFSVSPNGLTTPGLIAVDINYNQAMDPTSFDSSVDISTFTGPAGVDLKSQITGFSWLNSNKTLHITFNPQTLGGPYQMKVGPNINSATGIAVDDDLDGTPGELTDVTTVSFFLPVPQVISSTPSGATAPPVNNLQINFNQAMDPTSFAVVDDVVSFTGPAGNMIGQISGFTWTNANKTLQINFNPLNIPGSYSLVLAPSVLTAAGAPIDQNANGVGGENPDDRYTASFTTQASGADAFGYQFATTAYDASDVLVPGATGVTTLPAFTPNEDDGAQSINLGTNKFRFYGVEYTGANKLFVSTNGLLSFNVADTAYMNTDLTTSPSEPVFAPFWDDLHVGRNTATDDLVLIKFRDLNSDGTPDQLVICWRNVHYYNGSATSDDGITFSAVLELNTGARSGDLIANYTDLTDSSGASAWNNGKSATVGIKDNGAQGGNRLLIHDPDISLTSSLVAANQAIRIFRNDAPTAVANGPYTVASGSTVALSSAGTSDPNQAANTLTYLWDLDGDGAYGESGPSATRGDENVANPTFNAAGLPAGPVTVALRVIDSAGAVSNTTAVINVTAATMPPHVQSVTVDDGTVQRSMVRSLTITFDSLVTLPGTPASAFTLTGPGGAITLSADTSGSTLTQTIAKLTFSGPGVTAGSLDDGRYILTVVAAQVSNAGGQLDGNNDGTGGDDFVTPATGVGSIFRLFGDADGNALIDGLDFGAFRNSFNTNSTVFDFDGSGIVDGTDFGQFRQHFGAMI